MKIAIVSNIDNQVGLQVDYQLLRDFLVRHEHDVTGVHWLTDTSPTGYDLAIFLEVVPENLMSISERKWFIPNPEWLRPEGERLVRRHFEKVLVKTHDAYERLSKKFLNIHYVGFLTRDKYDPTVPRKRQFLHIGGNGGYRNTNQVLAAWREYRYFEGIPAEDAPLVVVSNSVSYQHEETPGVTFIKRATDEEITRLQNESMFHLYPSGAEGFGHAMHEALSVGATLLTTDAAPMNEITSATKIPAMAGVEINNAVFYEVNPSDIRSKANAVLHLHME